MKLLRIKLPDQLHARLKVQCAVESISMQQYAVDAISMQVGYLPDDNPKKDHFPPEVLAAGMKFLKIQPEAKINPALASANPQKRGM